MLPILDHGKMKNRYRIEPGKVGGNTHSTIVHLNQDENRAGYQLVVLSGDTAAEAQESRVGIFLLFLRGEGGNGVVSFSIRDS